MTRRHAARSETVSRTATREASDDGPRCRWLLAVLVHDPPRTRYKRGVDARSADTQHITAPISPRSLAHLASVALCPSVLAHLYSRPHPLSRLSSPAEFHHHPYPQHTQTLNRAKLLYSDRKAKQADILSLRDLVASMWRKTKRFVRLTVNTIVSVTRMLYLLATTRT